VPKKKYLSLILPAIVDQDGNQTILSRALLDAEISIQQGCGRVL